MHRELRNSQVEAIDQLLKALVNLDQENQLKKLLIRMNRNEMKNRRCQQSTLKLPKKKTVTKKSVDWRLKKDRMQLYLMQQRFSFDQIKKQTSKEILYFAEKDVKTNQMKLYLNQVTGKNDPILSVVEQTPLEFLMNYEDRFPFLTFRKSFNKLALQIRTAAQKVINHKIFERFCICVILANSITLGQEDPCAVTSTPTQDAVDNVFLALYTLEMVLKITGLGFYFGKGSYLKNTWNILDFVIVVSAYLSLGQTLYSTWQNGGVPVERTYVSDNSSGLSLNSLRAFRVLRPLRAITQIKGLQLLVSAVIASIPLLQDTITILFTFFVIFAIVGLQLLSGKLKNKCVNIETGQITTNFASQYQGCGGMDTCQDGIEFCGQQNANPNYGITNFDNLPYSLLAVYQCITCSGADIMFSFMGNFSPHMWILFQAIVYMGAFFLLNLLIAVINSSFGTQQEIQREKAAIALAKSKLIRKKALTEDDFDDSVPLEQLGINQFWIAKRYAKKMITILRDVQARKKAKAKSESLFGEIPEDEDAEALRLAEELKRKQKRVIKKEETEEEFSVQVLHFLDDSEEEEEIVKAEKKNKDQEIRQYAVNEMMVANRLNRRYRKKKGEQRDIATHDAEKLAVFLPQVETKMYKGPIADFGKLDEMLNLNNLIIQADRKDLSISSYNHPYDLSQNHSGAIDYEEDTDEEDLENAAKKKAEKQALTQKAIEEKEKKKLVLKAKSTVEEQESDQKSSVVASDSSFEQKILDWDADKEEKALIKKTEERLNLFKMQAEENQREKEKMMQDVKPSQIPLKLEINEQENANIEIIQSTKKKGKKKKKKRKGKKKGGSSGGPENKLFLVKEVIRKTEPFLVGKSRPKYHNDFIDKKTHKIEILAGLPYRSTSLEDVFEIRNQIADIFAYQDSNNFIKANEIKEEKILEIEPILNQIAKPMFKAYQLKTRYNIKIEPQIEFDEDDDDNLILALQPYDTVTSVGYGHLITHVPIKFVSRRSDIIVSSTLSLTMIPAASAYKIKDHGLISADEISNWCNLRHQYRAQFIETAKLYQEELQSTKTEINNTEISKVETIKRLHTHKDSFNQMSSNLNQDSNSKIISKQQPSMRSDTTKFEILGPTPKIQKAENTYVNKIPQTLLHKPLELEVYKQLNEEERRAYNIQKGKYETYIRIVTKKELQGEAPKDQKFTLADAEQLMIGAHIDYDDDDEIGEVNEVQTNYFTRDSNFLKQKIEDFENPQPPKAPEKKRKGKKQRVHSYIPESIKEEFNLPDSFGQDEVNFNEVIKKDCSQKRITPLWSGQDVLNVGLTTEISRKVISSINGIRVWPKSVHGTLKKMRVFLKNIVKHSLFNNFMTICVLLNTIIMAMQRYGMDQDTIKFLDQANQLFTWIFIVEMSSKVVALGIVKYLKDRMNWLDGSVVSLSLLDLILTAASGGAQNGAFKAIKVLRTLRILRIARLLRQLKSMQVIIEVITKSASSFVYITLLMFVFIFIYTLLGMQLFGGQISNPDYEPLGLPGSNYDTFIIAFYSTFWLLTLCNWEGILFWNMRPFVGVKQIIPAIYCVSWIFIGNYILLNLFLAILLDGFLSEDDEENEDLEELERLALEKRKQEVEQEKIRRLKKMGGDIKLAKKNNNQSVKQKKLEEYVDDIDDLNEKQITEIFLDAAIIKRKDKAREEKLMFLDISCERSLYLFSKQNPFRKFCYKVFKHKLFENFILFLIGISSLKLALDSYLIYYDSDSFEAQLSNGMNYFLNVCFLMELLIKNISMGSVMDEGSYIRSSWNQLDGFIVFTSILDMSLSGINIPGIKVLKLLRTLRPLRVISVNVAMKLIVSALFESLGGLANVILVVIAVWSMFAIFALNIFSGKMSHCDIGTYTLLTKQDCNNSGGSWVTFLMHYDNYFSAMLTLFCVATQEGWTDVYLWTIYMTDVDKGPVFQNSTIYGFFYVVFILIGSYFMMNFFIGVLFLKYSQAAKRETIGYSNENLAWIDIQKMIVEAKCPHELMNKPDYSKHPNRYKYWRIVQSNPFEFFILGIILLNIVQMGIIFEDAPLIFLNILNITNYFFTAIFCAEAYLKFRAYSTRYFDTLQNKFDFFICCTSIADIIMSFTPTSGVFKIAPQIARMLRVLRIARIVRLAKKNVGLQALMSTITLSVGALFNVFLLLSLALFIFAILANFFFGTITESAITVGGIIDSYHNFNNFGNAYLYVNLIQTGENWNYLMFDCGVTEPMCTPNKSCGSSYAPIYFISFVVFISNIMINLFILVIINQFEKYYMATDNPITKFKKNLEVFMATWVDFTATKSRCIKLREKRLIDFFKKLPMPIGLPSDTTDEQMKKIMLKMGIKCDDGYVYFNELLYRCMRRRYGAFRLNKRMQIHELKTQYKIYLIKLKMQNVYSRIHPFDIFLSKTVGNGKSVNPYLQEMYYNISFNSWLNYARKMQKREKFEQKQEKLQQKCLLEGVEFIPGKLIEPKQQIKYVQIEVEEFHLITSEEDDEVSDLAKEALSMRRNTITFKELKQKKCFKPWSGIARSKPSVQEPVGSKKGYKFLDLLKIKSHNEIIFQIEGATTKLIKLNPSLDANRVKNQALKLEQINTEQEKETKIESQRNEIIQIEQQSSNQLNNIDQNLDGNNFSAVKVEQDKNQEIVDEFMKEDLNLEVKDNQQLKNDDLDVNQQVEVESQNKSSDQQAE